MIRVRFRIYGRVQMVGFRYFTLRQAHALGVRGYVRNLADGSVEVIASGDSQVLTRFANRLEEGPPYSEIDRIEKEFLEPDSLSPSDFFIR